MSATWMRAHEFGQPLTCSESGDVERGKRAFEMVDGGCRDSLGLDDRELAELDPGAGHGASTELARPRVKAERSQAVAERLDPVFCDVEHDQLLLCGQPNLVAAGCLHQVGNRASVDPLMRPTVGATPT